MGDESTTPAEVDANAKGENAGMSFLKVMLIALAICVVLVGGAVYLLSGSSLLPFNYQGF